MNLEREVKLTVGPLFHLPDLSEVLDGFSAEGEGVQRFVTLLGRIRRCCIMGDPK